MIAIAGARPPAGSLLRPMRAPRALNLVAGLLAVLLLVSCGGDDTSANGTSASAPGCEPAEKPAPKDTSFNKPEQVLEPGQKATATVVTSCGDFVIELDAKGAPKTSNSFAFLAEQGFYDETWFHRIVSGAFIQGGDPKGDGTGGPGYTVTEPPPPDTAYLEGFVAMGKTAVEPPGSSGSQFFVVAQADAGLPPDYALVGQVIDGIDVVKRIAALGDPASGQTGTPTQVVLIKTIKIDNG
jgi:cyclophilin family peptidyl-prolyl cis-trans isomerase